MCVTSAETTEQRARWHKTWYAKPDNADRKRKANREAYHHRKSLGLCPVQGCANDPVPGKTLCAAHAHK